MQVVIQNRQDLPNTVFRYIKWKLYNLSDKFRKLNYANVHVKPLSKSKKLSIYEMVIKLNIKGKEIVIKRQAENMVILFNQIYKVAHMKLAELHR